MNKHHTAVVAPDLSAALLAGVLGGLLAGIGDAATAVATGAGARSWPLLFLCAGVTGAAGALLAVVWATLVAAVRRLAAAWSRGAAGRAEGASTALLGAPLAWHVAFSLFDGAKAATVPFNRAISVAIVALGVAAVYHATRLFLRGLGGADGRHSHRRHQALAFTSWMLGVGAHVANREIFPRLYPWFHSTLGFLTVALAVVGAAAFVSSRPLRRPKRLRVAAAVGVLASAVSIAAVAPRLTRNQTFRFFAFEKTVGTRIFLTMLPLPAPKRAVARADRPRGEAERAQLPDGPRRPDADVVLITVDALRADHLGTYGYERKTSPNLDALAKKSIVFERAYAQAPHTSFSVASMLTGKYYPTIARLAPGDVHDPVTTVLRRYKWKTAAFYPPAIFFVDADKLKAYQESHFNFEWVKEEFLDADKRLGQLDEFFTTDKPKKAFLWLHLFEPHEPYVVHEGFDFGRRDVDRYDSEIAFTDAELGKIFAYLDKTRPGAIIIVTADHGEAFDERENIRYHGTTLYEEQIRVPLIVHVPGVEPHRVAGPVELIDLAPTILGLLDIPIPPRMRGTDLGPWLSHPPAPVERLPPAFAEVANKRMVAWGTEKLICDLDWGYCVHHDLATDPGERKNLADERPERVAALKERLDDWLDDHGRFEPEILRGLANPDGEEIPKAIQRGRLGDEGVAVELATMLLSRDPLPIRREAARLLVTALPPRKTTAAPLLAALSAEDPEVRAWATVAAMRLREDAARPPLRTLVGKATTDPELRVHAALALAQAGDATGVPVLTAALDRCEDRVLFCQVIIIALGNLRDRRAVPALLAHVSEVQNRREMVVALGQIGDPAVVDELARRLTSDEYVPVRLEAARALGAVGGGKAVAALRAGLDREGEAPVRAAIQAALDAARSTPAPQGPLDAAQGVAVPEKTQAR